MTDNTTDNPGNLAMLVGDSAATIGVRDLVDRLAASDVPVLVTGPSGSGKEVVARLLHQRGHRAAGPLVALNCAAVPTGLLESEIFGHEAGAFTGATQRRRGRFELADGGTLLLDEIGEMPLDFQAKLLRVLETREVERVGGTLPIRSDVRIVAATNADLPAAVAAGRFRADLFYRLAVVEVALPPLAERRADIPRLLDHFLAIAGPSAPGLSGSAVAWLMRQPWPGNVRELRNFVARAAALQPGALLDDAACAVLLHGERRVADRWQASADAPLAMPNRRRPPPIVPDGEVVDLKALLSDFEQAYIRDALGRTAFGVAESARLLGLRRTTLVEKMRRLNIARESVVPAA
ncbi:MAG: sigma-54-dependent Fis family transcriptional regulator [Sphingomonadaceae bacterium]|nr:sigma-54-dependent Fis family transcriptional regulator [Sphingomonadaceae bacterium]